MPRQRFQGKLSSKATESGSVLATEPKNAAQQRQVLDERFETLGRQLRRIASSLKRADAHATISTSTIVQEAWMKLARSPGFTPQSELDFKGMAAQVMRSIVRDAARRRRAAKRGGDALFVTLDDSIEMPVSNIGIC